MNPSAQRREYRTPKGSSHLRWGSGLRAFLCAEKALQKTFCLLLYAEAKLGELIPPKQGRNKDYGSSRGTIITLPEGINKKQSHYAQQLNKNKEVIAQVVAKAREQGEVPVRQQVLTAARFF